jgi:hypothetical protein
LDGRDYLPIFWDFQGADTPEELNFTFSDALLDAEERLDSIGIEVSDLEFEDLFTSIGKLRRTLRSQGRSLLLLCDEVEEILNLHRQDPALLRKLRRAMQSQDGVRSVLTSSVRLCELAEQRDDTSPFLHGFSPPLYISGLSAEEALALVRQEGSPPGRRPEIESGDAVEICHRCDHHPYLIQLVCKRFLELGDLEEAFRQVVSDRMINYFFSVDFEMLSATEKSVLRLIAEQGTVSDESIHAVMKGDTADRDDALQRLENLGFIGRDEDRNYDLPSYFLRRWLEDLAITQPPPQPQPASLHEDPTISVQTIDSRYTLHEEIGAGATGSVFKARDAMLELSSCSSPSTPPIAAPSIECGKRSSCHATSLTPTSFGSITSPRTRAEHTSPCNGSRVGRSPTEFRNEGRSPCRRSWPWRPSSRRRWRPPTAAASSTATSSPEISWWTKRENRISPTSGSRA